jgi:CheY-like chemotaxis protein
MKIAPSMARRLDLPRLLLVDDSQRVLDAYARMFDRLGDVADVVVQSDPIIAACWAAHGDFDALMLDLRMPHLDGVGLLAYVAEKRAEAGVPRLPTVVFTGYELDDEKRAALTRLGMVAVIDKGVNGPKLIAAVRGALAMAAGAATEKRSGVQS